MLGGMFASNILPALTAQTGPQDATFREITCRELAIVDEKGNPTIRLFTFDDIHILSIGTPLEGPSISLSVYERGFGDFIQAGSFIDANGPTAEKVNIQCSEQMSSIGLSGDQNGKHHIDMFTKSRPDLRRPSSLEGRFFGIAMFDKNKSDSARALMAVSEDGEGKFVTYGPNDAFLWGSRSRIPQK